MDQNFTHLVIAIVLVTEVANYFLFGFVMAALTLEYMRKTGQSQGSLLNILLIIAVYFFWPVIIPAAMREKKAVRNE